MPFKKYDILSSIFLKNSFEVSRILIQGLSMNEKYLILKNNENFKNKWLL